MRRKIEDVQKELDEICDWLFDNSSLNPDWHFKCQKRNELLIEIEHLENPVELDVELKTKYIQTL